MNTFLGKKNYLGIGLALLLLVIGFFMLGLKPALNSLALNVAPFLLVIAFVVVIPLSLWPTGNASENEKDREGV
jgi:predicted tellurium resistance membrane protein TerC